MVHTALSKFWNGHLTPKLDGADIKSTTPIITLSVPLYPSHNQNIQSNYESGASNISRPNYSRFVKKLIIKINIKCGVK